MSSLENWETRLRRWIDDRDGGAPAAAADAGSRPVLNAYFDGGESDAVLDRDALPEPFVGDVSSPALAGVLLALNPGMPLPAQRHPDGALVDLVRRRGWTAVAAGWHLPPETRAWWRARAAWPARLTRQDGRTHLERSIVGIDMVPWHSVRFGRLLLHDRFVGPEALGWLESEVVRPAVALAARTALSRLHTCGKRRPVLFALAGGVRLTLEALGWSRLVRLDRESGSALYPRWPVDDDGEPVDRSFTVLLQPAAPWAIALVTDTPDGLLGAPEPAFDRLVLRLLRDHGCPCAPAHAVVRTEPTGIAS